MAGRIGIGAVGAGVGTGVSAISSDAVVLTQGGWLFGLSGGALIGIGLGILVVGGCSYYVYKKYWG